MKALLILLFPAIILANGFYDSKASTIFLSRIGQNIAPVTEYMTDNIYKNSPKLQKRGIIGDIKNQLREYIGRTYSAKAIKSFEPIMKNEMDNGFKQYYALYKRDGVSSPEQEKYRREAFAGWLSKRLDAKLKNHMVGQLDTWVNEHTLLGKAKTSLQNVFQKRESISGKHETGVIQKRYVERTGKTDAIIMIVSSFLLLPIFMNPFMTSIWSLLLVGGSVILFFNPIIYRMVYGYWTIF